MGGREADRVRVAKREREQRGRGQRGVDRQTDRGQEPDMSGRQREARKQETGQDVEQEKQ